MQKTSIIAWQEIAAACWYD